MNLISSAVEGVAKGVMSGLDDLFTSDEERAAAQFRVQQMLQQPHTIAAMTTLAEAKHPNWYVAGWRPAIGWVCAAGIGWEFVLRPLLQWAMYSVALVLSDTNHAAVAKQIADGVPSVDAVTLIGLVTTLLGMGVIRMNEKVKGQARS